VKSFAMIKKFTRIKNPSFKNNSLFFLLSFLIIIQSYPPQVHSSSGNDNKYFAQADSQILSQEYDKAIANYLKGMNLASGKEKVEVWDDLGYSYLQKKELEKAKKYLSQCLTFHPENFNPRFYLAVAYILNNEIEAASEQLKTIEENVHFDSGWMKKISGLILKKPNGKLVKTEELEQIKNEKGVYIEVKTVGEAIIHLDAFDERNEGVFDFAQGIVYKAREEFDEAEKKLTQALNAGYNERDVRLQLADIYQRKGKNDEINFKIFHRLKHKNNLLSALHKNFLKTLEEGKINEAVDILKKSLDADEQSFLVNYNLSLLCYDTEKLNEAEIYCARALWFADIQSVPKSQIISPFDLMGNIYFHQRKYEQALTEFRNILQIDERNAAAHYNLGSAHYALNDLDKAEMEWKNAIQYEQKISPLEKERAISKNGLNISYIVRKKPISFLSHLSLAQLYYKQSLIDSAASECEQALKINPSEPQPYFLMAKISIARTQFQTANSFLEKYLYLGGKKDDEVIKLLDSLKNKKK